eukprot:COSAG06_NODE_14914_length_1115_cov_0.981299_1_plen_128_part_00
MLPLFNNLSIICGHSSDVNGRTCLSQGLNGKACTTITRDTLLSFGLMSYLQVRLNIEPNRSEPPHSTVVLLVSSSSSAQVFVVKKPICLDRLRTIMIISRNMRPKRHADGVFGHAGNGVYGAEGHAV